MATVYLADDLKHGRKVALKVLRPELASVLGAERFLREIAIAARLEHPNVLTLIDSGEADGFLYYVMPFVAGQSLRDRLAREPRLPVSDAVQILREMTDALAAAHAAGVIHRDVKPDNVLFSGRHAIVTDFGIARALSTATAAGNLTTAGIALGTPAYMAPEQALADPTVDHRADIYALGVVAYEMLAGQAPFTHLTPRQLLAAHATQPPPPLQERRPDLPAGIAAIVMKCLAKDPGDRWQTCDELAAALDDLGHTGATAPAAPRAIRRWRWALPAAIAAVLVAAFVIPRIRSTPPAAEASQASMAILPFTVRGNASLDYLADGIVNLLGTSLDGVGGVRSVNAHALLGFTAQRGYGTIDQAAARDVASHFGAGLYVLGDVVQAGAMVRIAASLFDRGRDSVALTNVTVEGASDSVFALVDQLAARLAAARAVESGGNRTRIAAMTTSSIPAIKAYLEGEQSYRRGQYSAAVTAFQQAAAADSGFALALYRQSMAEERLAWAEASQRSAELALRHGDRLSPRDRQFLEAVVALRRGRARDAELRFRAILAAHPEDAEAWYQLGELLFHGNPLRGQSMTGAREALSNAVFYDPGDLGALYHLIRVAARGENRAWMDSLTSRFVELSPGGERTLELRALHAFSVGDTAASDAIVAEAASQGDNALPLVVWSVGVFAQDVRGARRVARLMTETGRPLEVRAAGHLQLAHLELALGRPDSARARAREAVALGSADAREALAWFEALPFAPATPESRRAAIAALESWRGAASASNPLPSAFFSAHNGVHDLIRAYLLGLLSIQDGRAGAAAAQLAALAQERGSPGRSVLASELARGLRAQHQLAGGHADSALATLRDLRIEGWYELTFVSPFHSGSLERFTLAELLFQAGRLEEALGWYTGLSENTMAELVFLGPSLLRRAAIHRRLGQRDQAERLAGRFADLWRDADPALREAVARRYGD